MSVVYLARRDDDQYRHRVAIKLLKQSVDSETARRRFRRERQILAGLEHPSIARLLDGGTTEEGIPYLVMEHVDGLPIDTFCDRRQMSVSERCALVQQVCEAVHAAHQSLVVHRDLKPSNLLVTSEGAPKLLDFGIARLLHPASNDTTGGATAPGLHPMTPTFASPEQLRGESVTTASDVHALGVLLYLLLTGLPPHRVRGLDPVATARIVCEQDARWPSQRAHEQPGEDGADAETRARLRGTSPGGLSRALAGDLDAIVSTALRKEPQRRYPSAQAMGEDLGRYLSDRPIHARRATSIDRLRKLVRRNRPAGVLAATALLLVAALAFQALRLHGSLRREAASRQHVQSERDRADAVLGFLESLIENADPVLGSGDALGLDGLLEDGARQARARFRDRPAVQARLLDTFGMALRHRGRTDAAEPHLRSSLALREEVFGPHHMEVAASLDSLGQLSFGTGAFDRAVALHRRALAIRARHLGENHPVSAESMHNLAEVLHTLEHHGEAEALYERALEVRRRHFGDRHPVVAESLAELAYLRHDQLRYDEAEALHRQALAIKRAHYGDHHAEVATALDYLAWTLQYKGELDAAEPLYREALAVRQALLGEDHQAVASSLDTLGRLRLEQGDVDEAESLLRAARAIWERRGDVAHPMFGTTLNNLALVLEARGRYDEAVSFFERVLPIYRRTLGDRNASVATVLNNLGRVHAAAGRAEAAEQSLRAGLRMRRAILVPDHPDVAKSLATLGELLASRGDPGAEDMLREAVALLRAAYGDEHWRVAEVRGQLGACLVRLGRSLEGLPLVVDSHERLRTLRGDHDRATRRAAQRRNAVRRDRVDVLTGT